MSNRVLPIRLATALTTAAVLVTACGGSATPTQPSIEAVYTSAAQTVAVQLTETALAASTATPTLSATPYPTITLGTAPSVTPFPTLPGGLPPASGACNAVYVSDVTIPDNTHMSPGQTFTKTWRLQNNGTCTWSTAFKIAFVSGEQMGGANTAITVAVPPNQNIDVSVAMTAPNKSGTLTGVWRMQDGNGQFFGGTVTVVIQTGGATLTVTQTGTPPTKTKTLPVALTSTKTQQPGTPTQTATNPPPTETLTPPSPTDTLTPTTGS